MTNTVKTIEVSKEDLVKAVEFYCSSAYSRPENWMYFNGVFCMEFFHEDEKPSNKDYEGYTEWLKLCGNLEDTDENYQYWLQSVREYIDGLAMTEITTKDGEEIEVKYI